MIIGTHYRLYDACVTKLDIFSVLCRRRNRYISYNKFISTDWVYISSAFICITFRDDILLVYVTTNENSIFIEMEIDNQYDQFTWHMICYNCKYKSLQNRYYVDYGGMFIVIAKK